jgi:hypothetical protein
MKIKYLIATIMVALSTGATADDACITKYIAHLDEHAVVEGGTVKSCPDKMFAGAKATCKNLVGNSDTFAIALAVFKDASASCGGEKPSSLFADADKAAYAGDMTCQKLDFSKAIAHVKENKPAQDWCSAGATAMGGKVNAKFAANCGCGGDSKPFQVRIISH